MAGKLDDDMEQDRRQGCYLLFEPLSVADCELQLHVRGTGRQSERSGVQATPTGAHIAGQRREVGGVGGEGRDNGIGAQTTVPERGSKRNSWG